MSIDLSDEGRIGFLAGAANFLRSPEMVALADKAANFLISKWKNVAPEIRPVIGVLEDMPAEEWFFRNGGEAVYLKLVDKTMDELYCATADECLALIEFQQKEIGWNDRDESRLSKALVHYEKSGAADDRRNCSNVSELSELREALDRLYSKSGIDLKYEIDRVDEEIAEREEPDREYRGGGGGRPSSRPSAPTMSDDEVRDMFRSLRERG